MSDDRLNEFLKNKVQNHETPMDIDAFWEGLEEKKKSKKRFFWWLFVGSALLVSAATLLLVSYNETTDETGDVIKQMVTIESANPIDKTLSIEQPIINSNSTPVASAQVQIENDPSDLEITQTETQELIRLTPKSASKTFATSNIANETDGTKQTLTSDTIKVNPIPETLQMPINSEADLARSNSENPISTLAKDNSQTEPIPNLELATAFIEHTYLPVQSLSPQQVTSTNPIAAMDQAMEALQISIPKRGTWSVGVYTGLGLAQRHLSGSDDYVEQRNQRETSEQVVHFGLDAQFQLPSGWYLKSGITYEQINERFNLDRTTELEEFINEDAIDLIYRRSNGTTDTQLGANSKRQKVQFRKVYNRYRSVDVPVSIGYSSTSEKKWNWFVDGGLLVSLAFFPEGQILSADDQTFIQLDDSDIFKSTAGLSLQMGAGGLYQVNTNTSIWVSPRFRYALTSMTHARYELEQSFSRVALEIGIRRRL